MTAVPVEEANNRLNEIVENVEAFPTVLTRNGRPVDVLIAVEDEEEIERLVLGYSPKFLRILELASKQIRAGKASAMRTSGANLKQESDAGSKFISRTKGNFEMDIMLEPMDSKED
ncbi:MAG: type II toxin-antitoxin system Phd/YefM family antitoxin [Candidatus Hydrogenedentes bacterium]|nr:type II toxin-antitoxin system Phd/YefM family antitoxin [Candidatus Hydrogenedentota bacterium]